jgi:mannose-6-phosphate isomerase
MLVRLTNTPRDYAWGSTTAIADLFGYPPTGAREAELWLGAHPGSPARVVNSAETLIDVLDGERLPFLLKVLAAESRLSLQAHPTMAQAAEGFARENAAGIPIDDPSRNYKDAFHKPELLFALSDTFDALCGFRPIDETLQLLAPVPAFAERLAAMGLKDTVAWLLDRGDGVDDLIQTVTDAAASVESKEFQTVASLAVTDPGDPGILISLLLNRVTLTRGQVLYLPAGNIHAYLHGLGIELMAASDNVLRGGLTPKHVDVAELLTVLDFAPVTDPLLEPVEVARGVEAFRPDVPDFELLHVTTTVTLDLASAAIALCTAGEFVVNGERIGRGDALFVAHERVVEVTGGGDLFIATSGSTVA